MHCLKTFWNKGDTKLSFLLSPCIVWNDFFKKHNRIVSCIVQNDIYNYRFLPAKDGVNQIVY